MYSSIATTRTTTEEKKHNNLRLSVEIYSAHYSQTCVWNIFIAGWYVYANSIFPHFFRLQSKRRRRRRRRKKTRCVVNYVISISIVFLSFPCRLHVSGSIVHFFQLQTNNIPERVTMGPSLKQWLHLILDCDWLYHFRIKYCFISILFVYLSHGACMILKVIYFENQCANSNRENKQIETTTTTHRNVNVNVFMCAHCERLRK